MGITEGAARRHLRDLQDHKLIQPLAVTGAALGTKALLGPKMHFPTQKGISTLKDFGLHDGSYKAETFDVSQYMFIGHALAVRDVLCYFTEMAREQGDSVEYWNCSNNLQAGSVRPDALFWYAREGKRIAGIVEADMGTERGTAGDRNDRWAQKIEGYGALFAEPSHVESLTGSPRARLVITVPNATRAEWISKRLVGTGLERQAWIGIARETGALWWRPGGERSGFVPGTDRTAT